MKKNKKNILVIGIIALIVILIIGLIYIINNFRNETKLSLEENRWIDSNKYNVIDIAVMNDIPVLSYNGKGVVYDYLKYVTDKYSLNFNVVPYKLDSTAEYDYKIDIVDSPSDDEIVLLKDNLVLLTKDNRQYSDVNDISNLRIGILSNDRDLLLNYFNNSVEFVDYDTYSDLKQSFIKSTSNEESSRETSNIDGIVISKLVFTKEIIENYYNISFYMNDLNKYFVLKTSGPKELNSIVKKSFNAWKEKNLDDSYNSNLLGNYFTFKNISDTDQKKLQSKSYVYGFIDYGIYNHLSKNKIAGFNELVLKDFNKFSGLSIKYTKYNSISKLLKDFNSNEIDFMLDIVDTNSYTIETYSTVGVFDKKLAIISGISNLDVIDNLYSLKGKEVSTLKDSYLEKYLIDNGIKVKLYNDLKDLTTDFSNNDIVLIDLDNYNYYKSSSFKDSKINYLIKGNDKYNYVINDTNDNLVFKDIFNFYLTYNSTNELISLNYDEIAYENVNVVYILILIILALSIYVVLDFSNHVKYMIQKARKNKKINLSKEEKIRYIDQLTSLKNRAYLNSRIESWDESEVYPQAIIIIDLNNISYVNDNYGREEGDKVITEAANILIQNQLQNSEIIRTDGNEFLIYLVGYDEKQIISYRRKLTKEFKNLSHGFGAASGYSIITDAIKTIDDAVNEATLDMKNNKEDIEY
jgi:diguanylate cyclase (GGDEF)-like protein